MLQREAGRVKRCGCGRARRRSPAAIWRSRRSGRTSCEAAPRGARRRAARVLDLEEEGRDLLREREGVRRLRHAAEDGGTRCDLVAERRERRFASAAQRKVEILVGGAEVTAVARQFGEPRQEGDGIAEHEVRLVGLGAAHEMEDGCLGGKVVNHTAVGVGAQVEAVVEIGLRAEQAR